MTCLVSPSEQGEREDGGGGTHTLPRPPLASQLCPRPGVQNHSEAKGCAPLALQGECVEGQSWLLLTQRLLCNLNCEQAPESLGGLERRPELSS